MNEINQQAKAPPKPTAELRPRIVVLGVGGAGGNAVNNMIKAQLEGVECVVANTDAQALAQSLCENRVQLGLNITQGLGAGSRPEIGRAAAEEGLADVLTALDGAHMLFITAGMGGGTGTGAAPVIAQAAREKGILTVGVITKPFHFEGVRRMKSAEDGIEALEEAVDTLIVIPNQNLFRIANEKTTFADAFKMADDVLYSGVRGVTDLMVMPGLINLDFADIRAVMGEMGKAMMGAGEAEGENRAVVASEAAIANPLLDDVSLRGARGVLINITGGLDMTLYEVDEAANRIRDEVDGEANIIFGSTFDEALDGKVRVSVFATGIDSTAQSYDAGTERSQGVQIPVMGRDDAQPVHEPALSRAQDAARATVQRDMFSAEAAAEATESERRPIEDWSEPARAAEPAVDERRVEPRFDREAAAAAQPQATDPTQAEVPRGRSVVDLVVEAATRDRGARGRDEPAQVERGMRPEAKPEPTRTPAEDVLEIPAFLRRQAN